MNTADILAELSDENRELFMKTSLYKHHFSSELVVSECDKSTFKIKHMNHVYTSIYSVPKYVGWLQYDATTVTEMIVKYLTNNRHNICDETDIQYYKNHPQDLFLHIEYKSPLEQDYNGWLQQGNKPRFMTIPSHTNIRVPKHIIYLKINCNCPLNSHTRNHQGYPPNHILFLDTTCPVNVNDSRFIAYKLLGWNERNNRSAEVMQAFYDYTFKRFLTTKSANTAVGVRFST